MGKPREFGIEEKTMHDTKYFEAYEGDQGRHCEIKVIEKSAYEKSEADLAITKKELAEIKSQLKGLMPRYVLACDAWAKAEAEVERLKKSINNFLSVNLSKKEQAWWQDLKKALQPEGD